MGAKYRILEHPSDFGIEVWGESVSEAFENAVTALIASIADPHSIRAREHRSIKIAASDREGLLVKLLSEVLFLFDAERFLTSSATFSWVSETSLEGTLAGEMFDERKHEPKVDIKAITYHQIAVEEKSGEVRIRFFVDI